MSDPSLPPTAHVGITIGVRHYSAATGEITTVSEPRWFPGAVPDLFLNRYPLCECPRCRKNTRPSTSPRPVAPPTDADQ